MWAFPGLACAVAGVLSAAMRLNTMATRVVVLMVPPASRAALLVVPPGVDPGETLAG